MRARELLEAERRTTLARVEALTSDFEALVAAAEGSNADDEHDPEGATIAFERSQLRTLLDQAERHLVELDAAMEREQRGVYGRCERCGGRIPDERLEARPTARTCVSCSAR